MKTLLALRTSMHSDQGASSRLAADFVTAWRATNPDAVLVERDLARDPVPHLTAERFQSFLAAPEARTPEQHAVAGFSDALIEELVDEAERGFSTRFDAHFVLCFLYGES